MSKMIPPIIILILALPAFGKFGKPAFIYIDHIFEWNFNRQNNQVKEELRKGSKNDSHELGGSASASVGIGTESPMTNARKEILDRIDSRSSWVKRLKLDGKVLGHENGLLDKVEGRYLTAFEENVLHMENQDRKRLYVLLADPSDPQGYEHIAMEYARNYWKEWPRP